MNYSTHTLINSHKLTMVPHAFGKDYFKGLWDGLSKVSQLAHDMLWWLVFLGPCWRWWLCWLQTVALGSFSQQFRQTMLSFNSWVKFQSGMEDSVRAWAPNRTTTSKLEPHAAHRWCPAGVLLICLKRTYHMFYPQKAPTYPILKHFFLTEGKKKSIKSVKYPKTHKWRSIHGINLRERP